MPDNKALLLRWFEEIWNQGRRETIDELLPADCVMHDGEVETQGPAAFNAFYDRLNSAFSEMRVTPHEVVSEGDLVCLRWSATMRHTGDGLGMPATGKQLHTTGITIVRFKDGRLAEAWQNWDMLGAMEQIKAAKMSPTYLAFQRSDAATR